MPSRLESLQRYPLSVILSFLTEDEGTCFLITNKRFALGTLPLFALPSNGLCVLEARKRHRYKVYPAEDPMTLLDRLNTRRLRRRSSNDYEKNKSTSELAWLECKQGTRQYPAEHELHRFLRPRESKYGITILASYPRSGNTLLRNVLERITRVVTGSDNRPDRPLSKALAVEHNLVGEGATKCVHVCKTHFPERVGCPFQGQRVILLIRNPYDAIDSYWNLNLTNTHTKTVTDEVYDKYQDTFQELAKNEIKVWIEFHHFWLNVDIPVMLVRFEDLIVDIKHEMERIVRFVTSEEKLSEEWNSRIQHACGSDNLSNLGSYKPRSSTSGKKSIGKSLLKGRYTKELLQELHEITRQTKKMKNGQNVLEYFGYDIESQGFPNYCMDGIPTDVIHGTNTSMHVNEGQVIRPFTDPFGRPMKHWRQSRTDMDKSPFPTVENSC